MPVLPRARLLPGAGAAVLCLAVAWIHVQDQGGFPGDKTPAYVGIGYYLLELAGIAAAALLLHPRARASRGSWLLAAGVALGPLLGYVLSRGPGLPGYSDDRGNWTEPLGLISLAVEGLLLVLAVLALLTGRAAAPERRRGAGEPEAVARV
jgi:peptidoglycan/LPS O-acetylase OafA/YrhL